MSIERMHLAFLTEEPTLGESYPNWPQHLTLVPPFFAEPQDVIRAVSNAAQHSEPFKIKVAGEAFFGPKYNIPVVLVETNPELNKLHKVLLQAMSDAGIEIAENSYIGDNYQPRITTNGFYSAPKTNQEFFVDRLTVMLKAELARVALLKIMLGEKHEK